MRSFLHIIRRQSISDHITCSVVGPCLILAGINAWNLWNAHWEHWAHEPPLDERPEYPYMNIRTKNYFWGDGDKVGPHCSRAMEVEGALAFAIDSSAMVLNIESLAYESTDAILER